MATIKDERSSVVVLGNFNPTIFHPEWLCSQDVISRDAMAFALEGEDGPPGLEIVHPSITAMNLPNLRLEVQSERMMVAVQHGPAVIAHDFVLKTLSLLSQTPVTALGINATVVFSVASIKKWHRFGTSLAPKSPWIPHLLDDEGDLDSGGLRTITMERSVRPDGHKGYIRVTVSAAPSRLGESKIDINDHFDAPEQMSHVGSAAAIAEILEAEWERSQVRRERITSNLVAQCEAQDE